MADPIQLRGLKEVDENLARLGSVAGGRVMRQAMFAATKPILDQAKANVKGWTRGSGALYQSLGRTFRAGRAGFALRADTRGVVGGVSVGAEGSSFVMQIGPRLQNRVAVALHNLYYHRHRRGIFYGHLLEWGHKLVRRGAASKRLTIRGWRKVTMQTLGSVSPKAFLAPALATAGPRAAARFLEQIRKRVALALRKQDPGVDNA